MKEICAKDAKEQTKVIIEEKIKNELNLIFESINKAIHLGRYYTNIHNNISNEALNKLKELGYVIQCSYNQKDGYDYKISWFF